MAGFDTAHVLALAALASSDGGQDPVDGAIRAAARQARPDAPAPGQIRPLRSGDENVAKRRSTDPAGGAKRVVKGAFAVVSGLVEPSAERGGSGQRLGGPGFRVLAVAAGRRSKKLAGLIALSDPPRAGFGDAGQRIAAARRPYRDGDRRRAADGGDRRPSGWLPARCVLPDQFRRTSGPRLSPFSPACCRRTSIIWSKPFSQAAITVGMCGDGANDAPALRQAQIGIAVSTATDVAKSAGGMVLTEPGLAGIVAAVREGRMTFQRIQNYTINSITKKIVTVLFLMAGLMMTGHAILTPLLMVILMITGDFLAMSSPRTTSAPRRHRTHGISAG